MIRRTAHRRVRGAAAVDAYPRSRPERDAAHAAYRVWIRRDRVRRRCGYPAPSGRVDLIEGRELFLCERSGGGHRCAASIPGIFPLVAIGEQRLINGGVVNNTPISHAVELVALRS
jgi:hypothetical protein